MSWGCGGKSQAGGFRQQMRCLPQSRGGSRRGGPGGGRWGARAPPASSSSRGRRASAARGLVPPSASAVTCLCSSKSSRGHPPSGSEPSDGLTSRPLTSSHSPRALFPSQAYAQVLGVRTWICIFFWGGGHRLTHYWTFHKLAWISISFFFFFKKEDLAVPAGEQEHVALGRAGHPSPASPAQDPGSGLTSPLHSQANRGAEGDTPGPWLGAGLPLGPRRPAHTGPECSLRPRPCFGQGTGWRVAVGLSRHTEPLPGPQGVL